MNYAKPTPPQSRNNLLARLHCIKKTQAWSDDEYRDILQARTGKRSAADLTPPELARLVATMASQYRGADIKRPRAPHEWSWVDTAASARRPYLKKLIMLMKGTDIARGKQVAYIEGIMAQAAAHNSHYAAKKISQPLPMCDEEALHVIIQILAVHVMRQGHNPNAVGAPCSLA